MSSILFCWYEFDFTCWVVDGVEFPVEKVSEERKLNIWLTRVTEVLASGMLRKEMLKREVEIGWVFILIEWCLDI